jgi:hypothetical protein
MLLNGTRYKTVRVTKRYTLQNGTRYTTVLLLGLVHYGEEKKREEQRKIHVIFLISPFS